jgi:hypothetical protein
MTKCDLSQRHGEYGEKGIRIFRMKGLAGLED